MKGIKRILIGVGLAVVMLLTMVTPAMAQTTAVITITVTPAFIGISNSDAAYTFPDNLNVNTSYYTNSSGDTTVPSSTVSDANCKFTITNSSTITSYLYLAAPNFSGGDAMTNSGTGSNGATEFGCYAWYSGETYSSKAAVGTTATKFHAAGLAALTNIKWGFEIKTQSNAWTSGTAMASNFVLSAASS